MKEFRGGREPFFEEEGFSPSPDPSLFPKNLQ
jgi:hypothetical protein